MRFLEHLTRRAGQGMTIYIYKKKRPLGRSFVGCSSWTVTQLLEQHHAEVVAVKEQIRYIKEILTKNASSI